MKLTIWGGVALLWCAAATAASTVPNNLTTTLTVRRFCTTNLVQPLAFGSFLQSNDANLPTVSSAALGILDVTCGSGTPYNLAYGDGNNPNSGVRRMRRDGGPSCAVSTNCIPYQMFFDSGRVSLINVGQSTNFPAITAANHVRRHNFYGRFNNSLNYQPGTYRDTVVLTLTY